MIKQILQKLFFWTITGFFNAVDYTFTSNKCEESGKSVCKEDLDEDGNRRSPWSSELGVGAYFNGPKFKCQPTSGTG